MHSDKWHNNLEFDHYYVLLELVWISVVLETDHISAALLELHAASQEFPRPL